MAIWLNEEDVRAVLSMAELIEAIEAAAVAFSAGRVNQPVRTVLETPGGFFVSMPAFLGSTPAMGAKLVTVFHANAEKGLPTHLATIVLLDPLTGGLLAVMDGRYITEARTGAASAVAARYLARPESSVLAIIGSGVQARSHLEALSLVRTFTEIRCWSPTAGNARKFASESGNAAVRAVESAEAAASGADVIVLVTASSAPVIRDAWVKPGACVISVGACRPTQREMDPAMVARGRLVVDSRAAALKESGDVVQGIREGLFGEDHIAAELGQVAADPKLGRTAAEQVTIFKSLGMAVEDVAAAELAYQRAHKLAKGAAIG
ncbi:MAG TPA: ornithine cyclodeaminase family protein [Bryobacteraceae bacterium]|nr:ornithine cyclodeaminase family protein [Bryobacteraceae bacterium]